MKPTRTSSRKQQHVALTVRKDVTFRTVSPGFDGWDLVHNALPELDLAEVNPATTFLGKPLRFPLMISGMTGGYPAAERINRLLAEVSARRGLAMGVGSQRQALENAAFRRSYAVVREVAPDIPVIGNIGAAEVARFKDPSSAQRLVDLVHADALAVHLNPLQELLQPEGTPAFRGVLAGIRLLAQGLSVPIMVKEIGAGLSADVARKLLDAGVRIIDVAGAGGTSWAGVELLRRGKKEADPLAAFWDWGIPTVDALRQVEALRSSGASFTLVASGGIRNGLDMAKASAFGADLCASARPFIQAAVGGGRRRLEQLVDAWFQQFRAAMFLTGSRTLADLRTQRVVRKP